jgi:hypothetical protein
MAACFLLNGAPVAVGGALLRRSTHPAVRAGDRLDKVERPF